MNENLISINANEQEEYLIKEIKKMSFIKYFNLLFSVLRFFILFFLIFLILYFPNSFEPSVFTILIFIFITIFLPLITIFLLIVIITGTIQRDFWIKKKPIGFSCYTCFCCCCIMSKNVTYLKRLTLISSIIDFIWSFILLYYYLKDLTIPNNAVFFPYSGVGVLHRILFNLSNSLLLSSQFYCFHYSEYFLKRVEKYIEYYKRLIIKNKNKEAEFVRNTLPYNIDNYISSEGSEMKNI